MQNNKMRPHHTDRKLFLLIALLLTIGIYLPGLDGPFLLDDYTSTLQLKMSELDWQRLLPLSFSPETGPLHRPLANASFALNFIFFGEETFSFKVTNLVLHLFTGIVLYVLGKKILKHCLQSRVNEKQANSIALVTSAIWLLHPLHVSTVLYVAQRMTQLSTLFTLLAVLAYIYGRERLIQGKRFAYSSILLGYFIFGSLGILSKETTMLLPGYIFLIEILVFRFRTPITQTGIRDKRFMATFSIVAILPILLGLGIFILKNDAFLSSYINRDFSLSERLLTESHVLWDYIRQYFLPQLSEMALHHDGYPITTALDTSTILSISGLLGLATIGLLLARKEPIIALGFFWFLLSHSLESTFFPLELKFEHRNYMAMFGLLLTVTYGLYRLTATTRYTAYTNIFLGLFIITLSYQTYSRTSIWASHETLFEFESQFQPNSFRLPNALMITDLQNGNFIDAREKTARLRNIRPWDASPALYDILIDCIEATSSNNSIPLSSTSYITESLSLLNSATRSGSMKNALVNLGKVAASGRCNNINDKELIAIFNTALDNPRIITRPAQKQKLTVQLARIHNKSGSLEIATDILEKAHSLKPDKLNTLLEKGYMELNAGDLRNARSTINKLNRLNGALPFFKKYTYKINELESFIQQEEMIHKH